ncbi:hypothetical protein BDZ97DRAFT_1825967 [Flammula alnicola]|nr:hypothetical protein BDZ97DRAFT_1825967 [Flammula alnicola]
MVSDVEMDGHIGTRSSLSPDRHLSPPPTTASAATSRRSSLAVVTHENKNISINKVDGIGAASSSNIPISIPLLVHSPSPAPSHDADSKAGSAPLGASSSTAPSGLPPPSSSSTKPASSAKPKSAKPAKPARSPSPSPPPPAVPLQTIRLDIRLGGPSNYEVDIGRQAKDTGQRPPTPPPTVKKVADSSDSEEDEDDKTAKGDKPKSKKKKKKNTASEYYDTSDPFIDDSELAVDERQYFAQTKQQGFYVSVARSRNPRRFVRYWLHPSLATDKKEVHEGTREAPIPIDGDEKRMQLEGGVGIAADAEHRKKVVDESMFHPDLQAAIAELKKLIAQESWENKGKFPPTLKPALAKLAILAIRLFLPHALPIPLQQFTMTKLIKRTVFSDHLALLTERQDVLLAEEEWEKSVIAWGRGGGEHRDRVGGATRHPTEEMDVDGPSSVSHPPGDGEAGKDGKDNGQHPPAKRYRMTEQMKAIVWELVLLSNECCRLENEKNSLEGSVIQISDQGLRKVLYQKVLSAMKKKLEREAMEQENEE